MVQVEADIAHVKRQIDASMIRKEALKMEYMTYTRTLQETEQSLAKATTVSWAWVVWLVCVCVCVCVCGCVYDIGLEPWSARMWSNQSTKILSDVIHVTTKGDCSLVPRLWNWTS